MKLNLRNMTINLNVITLCNHTGSGSAYSDVS